MANYFVVILLVAIGYLIYTRHKASIKNKHVSAYIHVAEAQRSDFLIPVFRGKSFLEKYFNQNFWIVYGPRNTAVATVLISGYVVFWVFVCFTFELSFFFITIGVFLIMSLGLYLAYNQFKTIFSDYFESSFPYALRLISRNMSVGQTIYSAVEAASQNLHGIMKTEFQRISDQLKNGVTFEQILDKGEKLYPYKGYYVFSSYLRVSIKKGSSLKDTLTSLADDLVSAQVIKKKTRSLTSESRSAAYILSFLPVMMLGVLYMFSAENFAYLFTAFYGRLVLIYVVISVTIGFLLISKMIRGVEL